MAKDSREKEVGKRGGRGKIDPEIEFLNGIFIVEVSGKNSSLIRLVFVWFSTLIFPFYKVLFMNRLEFSCFADFFCKDF